MGEPKFNLIFNGEISYGFGKDLVKQNLCSLLKIDFVKAESMFDGRTIVLKKNIDKAEADKYKGIFDKTGAVSIIELVSEAECQSTPQPQPPPPPPVTRDSFTCPKCGTAQEKASTCVRCGVIFEKLAAHSERQPHDEQPSDQQPPEKQQISEIVPAGKRSLHTEKTVLPGTRACFVMLSILIVVGCCSLVYRNISAKHNADWGALNAIESAEQDEQDSIQSQAESFLAASNYDELDKIADSYRTSKATFTDGEWKLCIFYEALSYYQRQVSEEDWVSRLNMLKAWVAAKPDSITARIALAECLDGYAFFGRGAAYSNEVQEDQWRRFQERLAEAKDVLDEAEKLQHKCPGWSAAYLRLAVGLQWDKTKFNEFLASAIAKEPTYYVYYYRAAWYLLPWWFGEAGDWEDFAKSAADSVGGSDGDILYTRIVWFIKRRAPRDIVTNNSRLQWQRVAAGIELIKAGKVTAK